MDFDKADGARVNPSATSAQTQIIKCKCTHCGLHFAAYSWNPRWTPSYCPECGQSDNLFLIWRDSSDEFIFQHVPGSSQMTGMPS